MAQGSAARDVDVATLELPCVAVRMNRAGAEALSRKTDPRTTGDLGYAIKTTIAELGDFMRPWRLIGEDEGDLILVGVAGSAAPTARDARRCGVAIEAFGVALRQGETLPFTLHANPTFTINLPREADGRRQSLTVDAAEGATDPAKAYLDWTRDRMGRTIDSGLAIADGLAIDGDIAIGRIRRETATRKVKGSSPARETLEGATTGDATPKGGDQRIAIGVATTTCRAQMRLRIVDPATAIKVMAFGIGKGKAFGIGSLLPDEAVTRAFAIAQGLECEAPR